MKKLLLALCLTSLSAALGAEATAPAKTAAVTLKQESVFKCSNERNPFWPIGWVKPTAHGETAAVAQPAITPSAFTLTSVTMGAGGRFAILNGKVVEEGQKIGLQVGSQVYQATVRAIEDGQVILTSQGGEILVPLRRR
jgi:hypothetical protein